MNKPKSSIPSPCVNICSLDVNDICIGCYRSGEEIAQWGMLDDGGKKSVLTRVALREEESNNCSIFSTFNQN
jgi:predicted Fe-S protein YdhL (DUF1289 family)